MEKSIMIFWAVRPSGVAGAVRHRRPLSDILGNIMKLTACVTLPKEICLQASTANFIKYYFFALVAFTTSTIRNPASLSP
jgi:hypothetical protein